MTLPASGAISLNQVNVELGNSGTANINMNSAAVRGLFDIASGAISMSDGYGKSDEAAAGQDYYTSAGTFSWVCPDGVTSVSVAALGGGGGCMAPGDVAGSTSAGDGQNSYFISTSTVKGGGGAGGAGAPSTRFSGQSNVKSVGGIFTGDGGGNGGNGGVYTSTGGGAGGYNGGGQESSGGGSGYNLTFGSANAQNGSNGGGGGGYAYASGSSTGLKGQGSNGLTNSVSNPEGWNYSSGGSGGANGVNYSSGDATGVPGAGGCAAWDRGVGGGGGGLGYKNNITVVPGNSYTVVVGAGGARGATAAIDGGAGGEGGVRIMWGNSSITRAYPSTNAGDQ